MQQILEKFNFLPNDDPYQQKTQPKCSSASVCVCMPILAAACLAVSSEIGNRQKRTELFYIYRLLITVVAINAIHNTFDYSMSADILELFDTLGLNW